MTDTEGWYLQVEYEDLKQTSEGDGAFPPREKFESVNAAVRQLLAGPSF